MSRRIFVVLILAALTATAAMGQTLPAPTIQFTTSDATGVQVNYAPVSGATSYEIQAFDLNNLRLNIQQTANVALNRNTITSGVPAGTQIKVVMLARTATTTSPASAPAAVITVPAPPTNIKGLGGLNKVTVSWTASAGSASYQLTLSNGMSFTTSATSYTVTGLQTATSYNVIVAGITAAGGRGTFSPAVAVRTANVALQ